LSAIVLLPLVVFLSGCDGGGEAHASPEPSAAVPTGNEDADLAELLRIAAPPDPTLTSDIQDAWLVENRRVMARLCSSGGPVLGSMALEAYDDRAAGRDDGVRVALLEVAAHTNPELCAPRLAAMIEQYDAELGLRIRTEAVRLLAETSPERALELLGTLVVDERPGATRPAQEALIRGWATAARALEVVDTTVPADVAINLFQPAAARYAAIAILGELGGNHAVKALEEVLVEATSDGMVRRKAAQGLENCASPEVLCPLLDQLAAHESDANFIDFLAQMIDRNCSE
jgi:hypothetical protein